MHREHEQDRRIIRMLEQGMTFEKVCRDENVSENYIKETMKIFHVTRNHLAAMGERDPFSPVHGFCDNCGKGITFDALNRRPFMFCSPRCEKEKFGYVEEGGIDAQEAYDLRLHQEFTWPEIAERMNLRTYQSAAQRVRRYAKKEGLEWPI